MRSKSWTAGYQKRKSVQPSQPSLALCMMVRDCARTLRSCLRSVAPYVDQVIIVLGGPSRDNTEAVAARYAHVLFPSQAPFDSDGNLLDFSVPRNEALQHVTTDYWLWLDGDDVLEGGEKLRVLLERMAAQDIGRMDLPYHYSFDEHGNLLTVHSRERIFRTDLGWRWIDPVHETPVSDRPHQIGRNDEVRVIHKAARYRPNVSLRNLRILERLEETPRILQAKGFAYFSLGRYREAQDAFSRYCDVAESDVHYWNAAIMAAKAALQAQDYRRARAWAMIALERAPAYKDAYLLLAQCSWWAQRDAEATLEWINAADSKEEAPLAVFKMPLDYTINVWDVQHRALALRGQWDEALKVALAGHSVTPTAQWKHFVDYYAEATRINRSVAAAAQLVDHLVRRGDLIRAQALLDYLPLTVRDDPRVDHMRGWLRQVTAYLDDPAPAYDRIPPGFLQEKYSLTGHLLKRTQWYIRRLKALGARKVLEVACHQGHIAIALARAGFQVMGIDIAPTPVEFARREAQRLKLDGRLRFECMPLEQVREQFDAVLLAEILEHLRPREQVAMLHQACDLAPVVLGSVPAEMLAYGKGLFERDDSLKGHVMEFSQNDLEALLLTAERPIQNCFKITDEESMAGSPGFGNRVFEISGAWPSKAPVAIYLGQGPEVWTPEAIDREGLGGSETAAALVAQELRRLDFRASIYGPDDFIHDGVFYRVHSKFPPQGRMGLVVISRRAEALDMDFEAEQVFFWAHDTSYSELTPERAARVDKFLVLSQWQRQHWLERYPWLDPAKVVVSGNGLRTEIYRPLRPRPQRHRLVYSSSPERGLLKILEWWPAIRAMWPDATLDVYYGWNYYDLQLSAVPRAAAWKETILAAAQQDGVRLHGRIGQKRLAQELARAQFWLHPSVLPDGRDWFETFCIGALEAQAAGCIPLLRDVGALPERAVTAANLLHSLDEKEWLEALRYWDELPLPALRRWRRAARRHAFRHTWEGIARQWLALAGWDAAPSRHHPLEGEPPEAEPPEAVPPRGRPRSAQASEASDDRR